MVFITIELIPDIDTTNPVVKLKVQNVCTPVVITVDIIYYHIEKIISILNYTVIKYFLYFFNFWRYNNLKKNKGVYSILTWKCFLKKKIKTFFDREWGRENLNSQVFFKSYFHFFISLKNFQIDIVFCSFYKL